MSNQPKQISEEKLQKRLKRQGRVMSLQDACDGIDDDLPDGAYWALAHDICGGEYGDCWDELDGYGENQKDGN